MKGENWGPSCGAWTASFPRDLKLSNWGLNKFASVLEAKPQNQSVPSTLQVQAAAFPYASPAPAAPAPPSFSPSLSPCLLPESCPTWLAPRAGGRAQSLGPKENKATFRASLGGGRGWQDRGLGWGPG